MLLASGLWSSAKSCRSQDASATPLATARYSASALERETTGCRLDDQETRLPPRKTRSRKWSGECPDSQPSKRRCRQPAQQRTSGEGPGRGPQCHGRSGGDASAQQGATPGDHAYGDRPAEQREIRPGEGEVLQGTGQTPVGSRISNRITQISR